MSWVVSGRGLGRRILGLNVLICTAEEWKEQHVTLSTYIGIGYSGAETPTSRLKGLQVYQALDGPPEVPSP